MMGNLWATGSLLGITLLFYTAILDAFRFRFDLRKGYMATRSFWGHRLAASLFQILKTPRTTAEVFATSLSVALLLLPGALLFFQDAGSLLGISHTVIEFPILILIFHGLCFFLLSVFQEGKEKQVWLDSLERVVFCSIYLTCLCLAIVVASGTYSIEKVVVGQREWGWLVWRSPALIVSFVTFLYCLEINFLSGAFGRLAPDLWKGRRQTQAYPMVLSRLIWSIYLSAVFLGAGDLTSVWGVVSWATKAAVVMSVTVPFSKMQFMQTTDASESRLLWRAGGLVVISFVLAVICPWVRA